MRKTATACKKEQVNQFLSTFRENLSYSAHIALLFHLSIRNHWSPNNGTESCGPEILTRLEFLPNTLNSWGHCNITMDRCYYIMGAPIIRILPLNSGCCWRPRICCSNVHNVNYTWYPRLVYGQVKPDIDMVCPPAWPGIIYVGFGGALQKVLN